MRTAGKAVVVVLATILAAFVLACNADAPSHPGPGSFPQPVETPRHHQATANPPNPNVNQPGHPQPDPGGCQEHCDDEAYAEMHAVWKSQTKKSPQIEYTTEAGQTPIPAGNLSISKASDGYILVWYFDVKVRSGQTIGFTLFGGPSSFHVECVIIHLGQFHSPQTDPHNCASSYTAP